MKHGHGLKQHLARKTCPVCQRPFNWRKKWRHNWDNVVYCSDRCRRQRHSGRSATGE